MNAYFIRVSEDKYSKLACKCQSREKEVEVEAYRLLH